MTAEEVSELEALGDAANIVRIRLFRFVGGALIHFFERKPGISGDERRMKNLPGHSEPRKSDLNLAKEISCEQIICSYPCMDHAGSIGIMRHKYQKRQ